MNLENTDLQTFPDLSNQTHEELTARQNYLRVVPEDFLPRGLKKLFLDFNYIKSDGLPVEFPNTIEELSLDYNMITDVRDVARFPANLKKLSIRHNPLCSYANLCVDSLEELTLEKTELDTISLLPRSLEILKARHNYLTMLPNRFPMNIRIIHLDQNCLRYAGLPSYWGTALKELHLSHNKIDRFPRNLPLTLEVLNLSQNRISELPASLQGLPNLQVLSLANNKLRTVRIEIRRHPIAFVNVSNNELTVLLQDENREIQSRWAKCIVEDKNWTRTQHQKAASRIQKNWRVSRIQVRIRTWKRTKVVKEELFCVSMMPERVWQTDMISPEWKRD
jgi:Leucine-rich repeat (LRR) protein